MRDDDGDSDDGGLDWAAETVGDLIPSPPQKGQFPHQPQKTMTVDLWIQELIQD